MEPYVLLYFVTNNKIIFNDLNLADEVNKTHRAFALVMLLSRISHISLSY